MSEKYKNEEGVYIDVHTDKRNKEHIDFYDKDPSDPEHTSIHIKWDSNTGKGSIVDTTDGEKETTDISCFLTTACMKYLKKDFDNNCEELTLLRWFRDNFVSKEEIEYYYKIAPIIVETIEKSKDKDMIYKRIYEDVIIACLTSIKKENYESAHTRYKNSVLTLEKQYAYPTLEKRFIKVLKYKISNEK